MREDIFVCTCCGERIWDDDNKGSSETPLCPHCYDHYCTNCARCGTLLRISNACYETDDDDEIPYCHSCHARVNRGRAINDYYYKPEPIFYGEGTRFFGVELEIDDVGEGDSSAGELLDIADGNGLEYHYCKHDGSLDDGFELVTHPMSLAYHQDFMPWTTFAYGCQQFPELAQYLRERRLYVNEPAAAEEEM